MSRAGFVLVGGDSARMGRDKALMPYGGTILVEWVAREVEAAAGSVTLVGPPELYRGLPYRVIPDLHAGCGPLGGIEAALSASAAEWNLIVACDMPGASAPFLSALLEEAEASGAECLIPVSGPERPEPLCAVYHRECLPVITSALEKNVRKVTYSLAGLRVAYRHVTMPGWAVNLNTPEDWETHQDVTSRRLRSARIRSASHAATFSSQYSCQHS
jgi:molybdopterin-guanine dinucleotide biosynthesis protein A